MVAWLLKKEMRSVCPILPLVQGCHLANARHSVFKCHSTNNITVCASVSALSPVRPWITWGRIREETHWLYCAPGT